MKRILILVLLPAFLLASYSSAQITAKKLPESTENAVIKANSVVNAIRMNPEIPFEEHAFLITTNTTYVHGVPQSMNGMNLKLIFLHIKIISFYFLVYR